MNECMISIGSITYALKARSALASVSVRAKIIKPATPSDKKRGCAYGLEFPCSNMLDVANELKRQGIEYELLSQ